MICYFVKVHILTIDTFNDSDVDYHIGPVLRLSILIDLELNLRDVMVID